MSAVNYPGRQSTTEYTNIPTPPIPIEPRSNSNNVSPNESPNRISSIAPSIINGGFNFPIPQGGLLVREYYFVGNTNMQLPSTFASVGNVSSSSAISSPVASTSAGSKRTRQMRDLPYTELKELIKKKPKMELHLHLEGANYARKLLEIAAQHNLYVLKKITSKSKKIKEIFATVEEIRGKEHLYISVAQLISPMTDQATRDLFVKIVDQMTMMNGTKNARVDVPAFHEKFLRRGEIRDKTTLGPHMKEIIDMCEAQKTVMCQVMYDKTATNPPKELSDQFSFPIEDIPSNLENFDMKKYIQRRTAAFEEFKNLPVLKEYVARCVDEVKSEIDASEDYVEAIKGWRYLYTNVKSPVSIRFTGELMRDKEPWEFFVKLMVILELMKTDKRFVSFTITGPEHDKGAINWFVEQIAIVNFLCGQYYKDPEWPNISYHAGETHNTFVDDTFLNWFPKIILDYVKPKRISHGNSFETRHFKMLAEQKVALEACVKSNEVMFGVEPKNHHIETAIRQGCTVIPCSDDPGVFESSLSLQWAEIIKKQKISNSTILNIDRGAVHCCDYPGESPYTISDAKYVLIPLLEGADREDWKPSAEVALFLQGSEKAQIGIRYEQDLLAFEKETGFILHDAAKNTISSSSESSSNGSVSGSDSDE